MKINDFAVLVAKNEGLKKEINIAQIKEILKVIEKILKTKGLSLYSCIKNLEKYQ